MQHTLCTQDISNFLYASSTLLLSSSKMPIRMQMHNNKGTVTIKDSTISYKENNLQMLILEGLWYNTL